MDTRSRCAGDATTLVGDAYEAYGPEITRFVASRTRDHEAAEDLAHEAFLRLHMETIAGRPPDDVRAWLYRVAANLATSRGRRVQVAERHAARLVPADVTRSPEDVVVDRERDAAVRAALSRLGDRDRDVVILAAAGLSGPELADQLGRTQLATRTLLCRARARLRGYVEAMDLPATSA
jgi:RNA polymerase sigma-70 factor (ECF subfamily)